MPKECISYARFPLPLLDRVAVRTHVQKVPDVLLQKVGSVLGSAVVIVKLHRGESCLPDICIERCCRDVPFREQFLSALRDRDPVVADVEDTVNSVSCELADIGGESAVLCAAGGEEHVVAAVLQRAPDALQRRREASLADVLPGNDPDAGRVAGAQGLCRRVGNVLQRLCRLQDPGSCRLGAGLVLCVVQDVGNRHHGYAGLAGDILHRYFLAPASSLPLRPWPTTQCAVPGCDAPETFLLYFPPSPVRYLRTSFRNAHILSVRILSRWITR